MTAIAASPSLHFTDRNVLCDGQTIKQRRLCVKVNGSARYGQGWQDNKTAVISSQKNYV